MTQSPAQLQAELDAFARDCKRTLDRAGKIIEAISQGKLDNLSTTPVHLSMLLEKYDELVDRKLIPAVESVARAAASSATMSESVVEQALPEQEEDSSARRAIARYNQRLAVRYTVPGRDRSPHKAFSRDVGAMGLFIVANHLEKSGQALNLEVDIPDQGIVKMTGTVVWTKWVPPALRAVDYPGFAVKINSAPESWFAYFMAVEEAHGE